MFPRPIQKSSPAAQWIYTFALPVALLVLFNGIVFSGVQFGIAVMAPLAFFLVFALLFSMFHSAKYALLVFSGVPLGQIGLCLAVGLGALVLGMGMFAAGWIGGGDGKLFAVCALWLGWPAVLPFMLYTGLAGGALTFAILGLRSGWLAPGASKDC